MSSRTAACIFFVSFVQIAQSFCPVFNIPLFVTGTEDQSLRLMERWKVALLEEGISDPPGLFDNGCINCQDPTCVSRFVEWNNPDRINATIKLEHGQMWLRDGFPDCGATIDRAFYEETYEERVVLSLLTDVAKFNCILNYTMFAGTRNANRETHLATVGSQPKITITVTPICSDVPPACVGTAETTASCISDPPTCADFGGTCTACTCPPAGIGGAYCGATFQGYDIASTQVLLSPVNDVPLLKTCPLMFLLHEQTSNLVSWNRADAEGRCDVDLSPSDGRKLGPVPAQLQPSIAADGVITAIPNTPAGTPIHPRTVLPPPCASILPNAPYCDKFSSTIASCTNDSTSYVYHLEDNDDVSLNLANLELEDQDLWMGHIAMDVVIAVPAGQVLSPDVDTLSVPLPPITSVGGSFESVCVGSLLPELCSQDKSNSLAGIQPVDPKTINIAVIGTTTRAIEEDGYCLMATEFQRSCQPDVEYPDTTICNCRSRVYSPTTTGPSSVYSEFLFVQVTGKAPDGTTGLVHETGFMDITLRATAGGNYSVAGELQMDPGKRPREDGELIDWYAASPMNVSGVYSSSLGRFFLHLETVEWLNPKFRLTVETMYGSVSLPNSPVAPEIDERKKKEIVGTMAEVNLAVSRIRYEAPGESVGMRHFNTMALKVEESIRVTIDDRGATGTAHAAQAEIGNKAVFDFNVIIVPVNDAPTLSGPVLFTGLENGIVNLTGIQLGDHDAAETLVGLEREKTPAEVHTTVTCDHCTLRVGLLAAREVFFAPEMPPECAAEACALEVDNEDIDEEEAEEAARVLESYTREFASLAALPPACRACLQESGEQAATEGNKSLSFFGTVASTQILLAQLSYQGDQGFNNIQVEAERGDVAGCRVSGVTTESGADTVKIAVQDLGNVGCTSAESLMAEHTIRVDLLPVVTPPVLAFIHQGVDQCQLCRDTAECGLCSREGRPRVQLVEDSVLRFSERGLELQADTEDVLDSDFPEREYLLSLRASFGMVDTESSFDVAGVVKGERPQCGPGSCRVLEMSGGLCEINTQLRGLTYAPDPLFNTGYGFREELAVTLTQISPAPPAGSPPPQSISIDLIVSAVNNPPTLLLNSHLRATGSRRRLAQVEAPGSSVVHTVPRETYDLFEGGREGDLCPAGAGACFEIGDLDVCEEKYFRLNETASSPDAVREATAELCGMSPPTQGDVQVVIRSEIGSIWFFSREGWEGPWPPSASALPPNDLGRSNRVVNITKPLPYFKGGMVRYYSPVEYAREDNISITVLDHNSFSEGRPQPSQPPPMCCCADQTCAQCVPGECHFRLFVSACSNVEGWSCNDAVDLDKLQTLSGVEVLLLVLGSAAVLLLLLTGCKLMGTERVDVNKGPLGLQNLHGAAGHLNDLPDENEQPKTKKSGGFLGLYLIHNASKEPEPEPVEEVRGIKEEDVPDDFNEMPSTHIDSPLQLGSRQPSRQLSTPP